MMSKLPIVIRKEEFEKAYNKISNEKDKKLINSHYGYKHYPMQGTYELKKKLHRVLPIHAKRILKILRDVNYDGDFTRPVDFSSSTEQTVNNKISYDIIEYSAEKSKSIKHEIINQKKKAVINAENNNKLLLLRTYGSRERTNFVFEFIKLWTDIHGSVIAIMDSSIAELEFRNNISRKTRWIKFSLLADMFWGLFIPVIIIRIISLICNLAHTARSENTVDNGSFGFILSVLFIIILSFSVLIKSIRRTIYSFFIKNEGILQYIKGNRYKYIKWSPFRGKHYDFISMYCFDNLWKITLQDLVGLSKYILMDLRGYSRQNIGCSFEINYILRNFSHEKMLYIIDERTDMAYLSENIQEACTNIGNDITIRLYRTNVDTNINEIYSLINSLKPAEVS